ncbi:hypothetical protein OG562_06245 [Streptomyces sp. NBC_01275]|nr:hypothetical protein [Streptomyces sp. NBC_01275]MCX4760572.1 hypothetical protein [Streptomyces sp. NBC_01275]
MAEDLDDVDAVDATAIYQEGFLIVYVGVSGLLSIAAARRTRPGGAGE